MQPYQDRVICKNTIPDYKNACQTRSNKNPKQSAFLEKSLHMDLGFIVKTHISPFLSLLRDLTIQSVMYVSESPQ